MAESKKEWPKYTWQEIASHNTVESLWVYNFEDVLDITSFVSQHPGGENLLKLFAGRDLTHVLPGYHPLCYDDKILKMLQTFKIGELEGPPEFPRFKIPDENSIDYAFRQEMKKYWIEKGWPLSVLEPGGGNAQIDTEYWIELGIQVLLYLSFKAALILLPETSMSLPMRYIFGFITGMLRVTAAIQIFHNGAHAGIDPQWSMSRYIYDGWYGLSFATLCTEHVVQHHTYTNVLGADPNAPMQNGPEHFLRLSNYQTKQDHQKWQFLYFPLAAIMMSMDLTISYIEHHLTGARKCVRINPDLLSVKSMLLESFGLAFRFFRDCYLPLFYLDVPWYVWFVGFMGYEMGGSFWAGSLFFMNHYFEETFFPHLERDPETGRMFVPYTFCDVMLRCSMDYGSYWSMKFTANLSCHSIHHFLPGLPVSRQLEMQPIVWRLAKERNIPYNHKDNIFQVFVSFVKVLYEKGREDQVEMDFFKMITGGYFKQD